MAETWTEGWHFCAADGRLGYGDGREIVVGETLTVEGEPMLCRCGLHASRTVLEALEYAPERSRLCRVRIGGEVEYGDDKAAATERTCLAMLSEEATERLLRRFACAVARDALATAHPDGDHDPRSMAAIETAERYADGGAAAAELDDAFDAAWAAWAAARDAAWAATWAAARDAAGAAARDAAWGAARARRVGRREGTVRRDAGADGRGGDVMLTQRVGRGIGRETATWYTAGGTELVRCYRGPCLPANLEILLPVATGETAAALTQAVQEAAAWYAAGGEVPDVTRLMEPLPGQRPREEVGR